MMLRLYLDQSHSEADSQDKPDVGEEPALHAGGTALNTNTSRLTRQSPDRGRQTGDRTTENSVYHVVNGPVGCLSLAEPAVGEVPGGERDVLAGARKQQLGTVDDDHVPVPVETAGPATALHLQTDGTISNVVSKDNTEEDEKTEAGQENHCFQGFFRADTDTDYW